MRGTNTHTRCNILAARLDRRHLLAALPVAGAPLLLPAPATAASMNRSERVQHHAEALLALIRDEFPEDATSMCVVVGSNWGPLKHLNSRCHVDAWASITVWEENDRMTKGGFWTERSAGRWAPRVGRY